MSSRLFIIFLTLLISLTVNGAEEKPKDWTVLVYLSGDNNLSAYMKSALFRLEMIASSENVNVIVQMDGRWDNDSVRLNVKQSDEEGNPQSITLEQGIEYDMGSSDTLSDFVRFGIKNFPAKKYSLVIFGHGRGILNMPSNDGSFTSLDTAVSLASSPDDSSESYMEEKDVAVKIGNVLNEVNEGNKLDLLVYDSCLMGNLEVLDTISSIANYAVASGFSIYLSKKPIIHNDDGVGVSIDGMVSFMVNDSGVSAKDVGAFLVDRFDKNYKEFSRFADTNIPNPIYHEATLALFDLQYTKQIVDLLAIISKEIQNQSHGTDKLDQFYIELLSISMIDEDGYIDLGAFLKTVNKVFDIEQSKTLIRFIKSDEFILNKTIQHVDLYNEGISIYFPTNIMAHNRDIYHQLLTDYNQMDFAKQTGWSQLISQYQNNLEKNKERIILQMAGDVVLEKTDNPIQLQKYDDQNMSYLFLLVDNALTDLLKNENYKIIEQYLLKVNTSSLIDDHFFKHKNDLKRYFYKRVQNIQSSTHKRAISNLLERI